MKILTWNINGLRSIVKKTNIIDNNNIKGNTFENYINYENCDIVCFNEIRLNEEQLKKLNILDRYKYQYSSHSNKKQGYSGVSVFSKIKPINIIDSIFSNDEGRMITLEFIKYYLVVVYTPNSGSTLQRLEYRTKEWDINFKNYIKKLNKIKPVIITGDLNVAHNDIDIYKPEKHHQSAGFTNDERNNMYELLNIGLIDTYRYLHPKKIQYSYYDYKTRARIRNAGRRIDYFIISNLLKNKLINSIIESNIYGSDHLPIILEINL